MTIAGIELSWIDLTSLAILLLFFVWGIFRGLLWQASRLACLALGYLLATLYAEDVARFLETRTSMVEGKVAVYVAYFTIFLAVLIILSYVTLLLERLVHKLQLSFYNRMGGGVLGIGMGGALVLLFLGCLYVITPDGTLLEEARASHTARLSRFVVDRLPLPPDISALYGIESGSAGYEGSESVPGEAGAGQGSGR